MTARHVMIDKVTDNRLVFMGIGLGVLFWFLEAWIHTSIFHHTSLTREIFAPDPHEVWMRSLFVCFLIFFGVYAQHLVNSRRRAEEENKLAHAELDQIFQTAADGMRIVDKTFTMRKCNDTFAAMIGLDREKAVGRKCYDLFRGSTCHTPNCSLARIIAGEERVEYDDDKIRMDGEKIPCIVTATPFRGPDGELIGIVEDFKDITERNEAEGALRESEEHLRSILDTVQTGVFVIDPETHMVVDVNPAAAALIGAPKEKVVGRVCHRHVCAAEAGKCPITDLNQEMDRSERVLLAADGREIPILKTVVSVTLGGRDYLLESFLDITERKQGEDALRASEEKYRSLVESTEDSVYLVDGECNYLFMNEKHLSRFGMPESKVIGKGYGAFHSPKETNIFAQKVKEVIKTGRSSWHDYRSSRDGKHFMRTLSPVRGPGGETIAVTIVSKDITERKRLELELQHSQRMEAIGTLAGGIAHNFNNLLMGIQGHLALLSLSSNDPDSVNERTGKIEKLVENGSQLTSQLLGYAREGRYEVKTIDLNHLVSEASQAFSATNRQIRVHRELAEDLLGAHADNGQIEQVLWNLLVNASDAMSDGGDLFLRTRNVTHEDIVGKMYVPKPGSYVLLEVADTGTGMDEKTLARAFDPFFTTKVTGQGTGLGLSSVYGIVKAHDGYIDVESKSPGGTTFRVYLPSSTDKVRDEAKAASEPIKGSGTVLLVEDEPLVLDVGKELLEVMGYTVLAAKDGEDALEIYAGNQDIIDIVVLDMIMPGMGGGEVYDRLKEINPNVKVLLSSGFSLDGKAKEILERGCNGFIQKPFSVDRLSKKMTDILKES